MRGHISYEFVENKPSREDIKKALIDVLDGNYEAWEIQANTGLSLDRCEEIESLFHDLCKEK